MATAIFEIDPLLLRELEQIQREEGKPLGQLMSELLAQALVHRQRAPEPSAEFRWNSKPMRARVDLSDKEALRTALGGEA